MENKWSIEKACAGFRDHFGVSSGAAKRFMDPMMTNITGKFSIDIIQFDNWLHAQGYVEETHGSMKDYIELAYGKNAVEFIQSLI